MRKVLSQLVDLREGEGLPVFQAFITLFCLIGAHTMLETARDALFLGKLEPSSLAWVYGLLAGLSLIVSAWNARFIRRFGRRNALIFTLLASAYGTTLLHFQPQTPTVIFILYVWSGLLGTVMVVQFWMFAGQLLDVSQSKRLFGPIAAGGVLGAVAGASVSVAVLALVPVATLLLIASGIFVGAAVFLTTVETDENQIPATTAPTGKMQTKGSLRLFREHPYLMRVAALTVLSTAAVLTVDYLFKSVAASQMPKSELGPFFARYYAVLNAIALVVQVALAGPLVRRLGVVAAVMVMPILLLAGGVGTLALGGTLTLVLVTKGADGALRHSLHRVTSELLSLPVQADARDRAKPLLDTVASRGVQALTAGLILLLAMGDYDSPRVLAAILIALTAGWLFVAIGMRRPYKNLYRQAISKGSTDAAQGEDLDLGSVEAVMEALSGRDATRVIAAMDLLQEKGRARLIPGLILYHESEEVLLRALEVVADSKRRDWIPLGERLLSHASEPVRVAALRALAGAGHMSAIEKGITDPSPAVRAHAALCLARADDTHEPLNDPRIIEILAIDGDARQAARVALLDAIRDHGDPRWADVIMEMTDDDAEIIEHAALAMAKVKDPRFIPVLIERLTVRNGRTAVRDAIVELGEPAEKALEVAMRDPTTDPSVRLHIPRTISRFGSQRAADFLTEQLGREAHGTIRYKVLRGLGRLIATDTKDIKIKVDRGRVQVEIHRNLVEHMRILSLSVALEDGAAEVVDGAKSSGRLVAGLLEDKMRQSLERAFRLLQIVHRHEDIRTAYFALRSADKRVRANAAEYLDALTAGRTEERSQEIRAMLRLVADNLKPADRAARAAPFLPPMPETRDLAVMALVHDKDESLASLAAYHALELQVQSLREEVEEACKSRPSLLVMTGNVAGSQPMEAESGH